MNWRSVTTAVLVIVPAAVIVFDVLAAWRGGSGATISEITLAVSVKRPIIPFALGVLCGHLFWCQTAST